jgi:3-hydroxy-9,10-secoandrosta-1,3,5(10)-triene-9,17-dione monooxygenase reductase component
MSTSTPSTASHRTKTAGINSRSEVTVDAAQIRRVLGHFCSGVTIITAVLDGEPVGFTCQSFASLSLEPPMVIFAASRSSTTWPKIRQAGIFCVNVLSDEHSELSNAFARSGTDKFAGVQWRSSRQGTPVFDGVVAYVDCRVWAEYDGGDHTIVAASVLDHAADSTRRPLLFHRGNYGLQAPEQQSPDGRGRR